MNVRRAVILAADYGTRFLPATKEMLPLADGRAIQNVVEQAVRPDLGPEVRGYLRDLSAGEESRD